MAIATGSALRQQQDMPDAIAAATVIIVRDLPQGHEVLMIERHAQLAFAGGAAVFPGGRIDEDDRRIAALPDLASPTLDEDEAAARIAAIRESLEETGIAVGIEGLAVARWPDWRAALHKGAPLSELLRTEQVRLDLARLTPFARWRPNFPEMRIFDTRFYLAKAPDDGADPGEADGGETTRVFWTTPQDMLATAGSGGAHIIFPTRRNLERLAAFPSHAALDAHARATPVATITPWVEDRAGEPWLRIADGLGYPIVGEPMATARRG